MAIVRVVGAVPRKAGEWDDAATLHFTLVHDIFPGIQSTSPKTTQFQCTDPKKIYTHADSNELEYTVNR